MTDRNLSAPTVRVVGIFALMPWKGKVDQGHPQPQSCFWHMGYCILFLRESGSQDILKVSLLEKGFDR